MTSAPINVALVGFGMVAKVFHAPLITANPNLHLHMVVERHSDTSKTLYPWVNIVKSFEDVLNAKDVQLVVILTPNQQHYEMAKKALQAGKHVVVDKPFTITSAEARELAEMAKSQNKVCSVFQNRRWDGDFLTVQKLIEAETLGRVVEVESHFDRFRNVSKANAWREADVPGSGMLYDLGAHLIDQALTLFGKPDSLIAQVSNQRRLQTTSVDDDFHIILNYSSFSGIKGSSKSSVPAPLRVILRSSMLARATPVTRFIVRGMNGTYTKNGLDIQEDQLKAGLTPKNAEFGVEPESHWGDLNTDVSGVHVVGKVETLKGNYAAYYQNVADVVSNKKPMSDLAVSADDGANVIYTIELATKSSEQGGSVVPFQ
ncbi:hypothetical protein BZG36_04155 [Bifiguratus adelaidae]|uniref:Oxidoreductase n=1 Tax=Bifiguratus adelaidae TaxID=1938954 RepID=A0A261XZF6_9FUNG|nr:hypothetical protein BZG36_04155 [Bifiguratus adelaidae]